MPDASHANLQEQEGHAPLWSRAWLWSPRGQLAAASMAGGLLLLGGACSLFPTTQTIGTVLLWAALGVGCIHGGRAAWESLASRTFDIDVLMIVAAGFAAALGHPGEGGLLLFLFVLAGALEERAMERTQREVKALHSLMPTEAITWRPGAGSDSGETGEWVKVTPEELRVGDRIKIRPGDRVPTDSTVVVGTSSIDQSAITGESMPRMVGVGNGLFGGTINTDDPLEAVVTKAASESSLQRVLALVTQAREQREPVQRLIDRLSQPYSISVALLSLAVFFVWWGGIGFTPADAAYTAITLLIVASPCALVIATPTATLSAIARAARGGVLFKGGAAIERLASISRVCFDKTGTLTYGKPRLYEVHPVAWSDGRRLLALAAGLEADSSHPIAQAVRAAAEERQIEPIAPQEVNHTAGRGLSGVHDGAEVRLGSYKHAGKLVPVCLQGRVQEILGRIQSRGHIGVVMARAGAEAPGGGEAAVLIMADAVRPGAVTLVRELHALGVKPVRMLTGDNRATAQRVGAALGIDIIDAELSPEDKLRIVGEMKQGGRVGVIGDGVNDAAALAAADVGIAIGSIGSDAALESADIVLLSNDLGVVPWALRLARAARRTVKLNLAFALGIIIVVGLVALLGSLMGWQMPMWAGVLAHEGGTLLVVANSLRLLMMGGAAMDGELLENMAASASPSQLHSSTPAAA
ncbi:MAG: cation-translocating P-type ATPase [Planctomycetota bacterium]|nr:cation-translocating P-type ATPase [Planctomycetota bacterium]